MDLNNLLFDFLPTEINWYQLNFVTNNIQSKKQQLINKIKEILETIETNKEPQETKEILLEKMRKKLNFIIRIFKIFLQREQKIGYKISNRNDEDILAKLNDIEKIKNTQEMLEKIQKISEITSSAFIKEHENRILFNKNRAPFINFAEILNAIKEIIELIDDEFTLPEPATPKNP